MARFGDAREGNLIRTPATGFPGFIQGRRLARIITSDIWACLHFLIESREILTRERKVQALAYIDQAFDFYQSAGNPEMVPGPCFTTIPF